jgi:hypothetical protein
MMVANVTAEKVRAWLAPADELQAWKEAYEAGQWFWLIKQWNDYHITAHRLCPACPDSVDVVRTFAPLLWQNP